jgi:CDP-diacylglycerol--glycerol-3-phosphate 3-phosphatidyltransferase
MWTLPNIVTLVRIAFTPVIALLPFIEGYWPKFLAFIVFVLTAVTDVWDGYLARSRNQVTDLGKLLDPLADKLLLLASLIPIYWISRTRHDLYDIPIWGSIPLGVVIAAVGAGKLKAMFQNIFIGATILWFAYRDARRPLGWEAKPFFRFWNEFHGGFVAVTLGIAVALTVYSFLVYLYRFRALFSSRSS